MERYKRLGKKTRQRVKYLSRKNLQSAEDKKINVVTWNVEGKGSPKDIDEAVTKTFNQCPDVVCLQEANLPAAGEGTENFKWYCSGVYGSAILIRKSSTVEASNFEKLCNQICIVEITNNKGIKSNVISCYIPSSSGFMSADIWTKLVDLIKAIHSNIMFILAGDFNTGTSFTGNNASSMNTDSEDITNENGVKLNEFIMKAHLKVISKVRVSAADLYTYKDGDLKSQRDFILIPTSRLGSANELKANKWFPGYKHAMHCRGISFSKPSDSFASVYKLEEEPKKPELGISTWNIQSTTPEKVDKLLNEQNLQIVCIQEFFLTSDEEIKTDNYTWFLSKKQWSKNVGILVKTSPDISVSNFEPLSECLCTADVLFHDRLVKIISCHLPLHSDPRHEAVANQLTELINGLGPETFFILAGDFSTKAEKKHMTAEEKKTYDDNDNFLTKLMLESKLFSGGSGRIFFTQIIGTVKKNPHRIFIPTRFKDEFEYCVLPKWIPYYDNAIVYLAVNKFSSTGTNGQTAENVRKDDDVTHENMDGSTFTSQVVEFVNEFSDEEEEVSTDNLKSLSSQDVEEFKNTQASAKDLSRLLNDFVLYFAGNDYKHVGFNLPINVIARSLKDCKLGKLILEEPLIYSTQLKKHFERKLRIRWNDILLQETYAENEENIYQLRKVIGRALLEKLHQVFYIIKAKRSFYNTGLSPILSDEKLAEILKPVEKGSFPTMEEVFKHIEDFFKEEDTLCELLFKKEFMDNFAEIKAFAKKQKMGYRFFSSSGKREKVKNMALFKKSTVARFKQSITSADASKNQRKMVLSTMKEVQNYINNYSKHNSNDDVQLAKSFTSGDLTKIKFYANRYRLGCRFITKLQEDEPDSMTVFKRWSPFQLREHLKLNPENPKYYLIPPCGLGMESKASVDQLERAEDKIIEEWNIQHKDENAEAKSADKRSQTPPSKNNEPPRKRFKRPRTPPRKGNEPPIKKFQQQPIQTISSKKRYESPRRAQGSSWNERGRARDNSYRDSGSSWNVPERARANSYRDSGSSWNAPERARDNSYRDSGSSWNVTGRGRDTSYQDDSGYSWNAPGRARDTSYRDDSGSSWNVPARAGNNSYQDTGSSWNEPGRARDNSYQNSGSSWNQPENTSVNSFPGTGSAWNEPEKAHDTSYRNTGSSWNVPATAGDNSYRDTGSSWNEPERARDTSYQNKGSSWNQPEKARDNMYREAGSSWNEPAKACDNSYRNTGSSWNEPEKPRDNSYRNTGSSWNEPEKARNTSYQGPGSSWNEPERARDNSYGNSGSSWNVPARAGDTASSWNEPEKARDNSYRDTGYSWNVPERARDNSYRDAGSNV